jgi:hypothetical protein
MKFAYLLLIVIVLSAIPTYGGPDDLLTKFVAEKEQGKKEQLMNELVSQPDAGPTLLRVAVHAADTLTTWMSVRGIGMVKYGKAVPFLIDSLTHQHPYVRANAARALGPVWGLCADGKYSSSRQQKQVFHERLFIEKVGSVLITCFRS